jgi:hypothetical protein
LRQRALKRHRPALGDDHPACIGVIVAPIYLLTTDYTILAVALSIQGAFAGAIYGIIPSYANERLAGPANFPWPEQRRRAIQLPCPYPARCETPAVTGRPATSRQ